MERQQLGLMQPYTASLNSVVRPDAPPETAILITDDSTPTSSSFNPMTPPSPSAPLLQSHPHSLHPHHGPSPVSSPTSSHQRLHSYPISVDEHGKDVIRSDVLSEKMSFLKRCRVRLAQLSCKPMNSCSTLDTMHPPALPVHPTEYNINNSQSLLPTKKRIQDRRKTSVDLPLCLLLHHRTWKLFRSVLEHPMHLLLDQIMVIM
ncbi:MAG: hypothetical protein J3Q66DRAFT_81706 [Benniella sp.]|nr:MAG: hypothetical protein J3Q66DRAFT_81706 [Benniella sp.]